MTREHRRRRPIGSTRGFSSAAFSVGCAVSADIARRSRCRRLPRRMPSGRAESARSWLAKRAGLSLGSRRRSSGSVSVASTRSSRRRPRAWKPYAYPRVRIGRSCRAKSAALRSGLVAAWRRTHIVLVRRCVGYKGSLNPHTVLPADKYHKGTSATVAEKIHLTRKQADQTGEFVRDRGGMAKSCRDRRPAVLKDCRRRYIVEKEPRFRRDPSLHSGEFRIGNHA